MAFEPNASEAPLPLWNHCDSLTAAEERPNRSRRHPCNPVASLRTVDSVRGASGLKVKINVQPRIGIVKWGAKIFL